MVYKTVSRYGPFRAIHGSPLRDSIPSFARQEAILLVLGELFPSLLRSKSGNRNITI